LPKFIATITPSLVHLSSLTTPNYRSPIFSAIDPYHNTHDTTTQEHNTLYPPSHCLNDMAIQNDRLPYAPGKRQPKKKVRPRSDALKTAAERLDIVNGMVGGYRAPAIIILLSDDEGEDLTMYEKNIADKCGR
jgi:hypothetical protein